MDNKHLSDEQIARCAESLIVNDSINFSESIKNHLEDCIGCSVQVQVRLDSLKAIHKDQICYNLSHNKKAHFQYNIWFGVAASIIFMVALGLIYLKH